MDKNNSQQEISNRELRMGTEPIFKLLVSMSLPAMISMLVQACYNVVDSIYVSRLGEEALAAVSLAFPIQMLVVALSVGTGIGINSGISRKLGQKRIQEAVFTAEHGLLLSIFISLMIFVLGLIGITPYLSLFGTGKTLDYAIGYADIVTYLAFGGVICQAGFAILQGSGNMIQPMIGQLLGAVTNIILDPIFIFGYLGMPKMEVNGAAVATVIGQILSMVYVMFVVFFRKKTVLKLDFRKFKFKWPILKDIIVVGVPSVVMQGIGSVMLSGYNYLLASFGTTALAVFGIYFKVQSFVFMPIFGLGQGAMPIFGYNFGARNEKRFMETMKYAMMISTTIMILGLGLFELFPNTILRIFDASQDMLAIGSVALRTIALSFPFAGICIVISNSFQAMGKSYVSMIASILRQIVVLLPAAYIYAIIGGLNMNWYSFVTAEVVSLTYLAISFIHTKRKVLDQFPKTGAVSEA